MKQALDQAMRLKQQAALHYRAMLECEFRARALLSAASRPALPGAANER